jgi:hypothetical protein
MKKESSKSCDEKTTFFYGTFRYYNELVKEITLDTTVIITDIQ